MRWNLQQNSLKKTSRGRRACRQRLNPSSRRISQRRAGISEQEEKLRKLVAEADLVHQDISQRKEEIEKENEDLIVVEQELRGLRQQLSHMTARLSELDVLED